MDECAVCKGSTTKAFSARLLGKYEVEYRVCSTCGFLQSESPYWLEEAYRPALGEGDTGMLIRNQISQKRVAFLLFLSGNLRRQAVDVGGGYGIFVRLMRDFGADFYWEDKYARNIFATGFESSNAVPPVALVTAFELLEHLHNPVAFLTDVNERFQPDLIMTSTELMPNESVPNSDWHYYDFERGQHISFYTKASFKHLADGLGMSVAVNSRWQLFSKSEAARVVALRLCSSPLASAVFPFLRRCVRTRTPEDHELTVTRARQSLGAKRDRGV